MKKHLEAYLLLAPKMLCFAIFMALPFVAAIYFIFHQGTFLTSFQFVGLQNFKDAMRDSLFWRSLNNTLLLTLMVVPLSTISALFVAYGIYAVKSSRLKSIMKAFVFFPLLSSIIVTSIVWGYLLNHDKGIINNFFSLLGLSNQTWLANGFTALIIIAVIEVYRGIGFYSLTYLAAMQEVPKEIMEAASLDGVSHFKMFYMMILPLIRHALTFGIVICTIWALQIFDIVYVLTNGGPGTSTYTMAFYIYRNAFVMNNIGLGATMSFILMMIIMLVTLVQLRLLRHKEAG
ncbi:carbohydrate ABC transporter permease [Paenibacillus senegalensis]|uniref:carbohydrate ABC transporter permease n=1 Tax=Paenibacillus senegalensis TaxID=1465766 RepID=UPI000288B084|nr:sugar ABC transporter permease [Paenibacillus senegalensis]